MPAVPTSISAHVAALPAPRVERTMTHPLLNIEAVALCAVLRGADKGATVAAFGRAKGPWLRIFLAPPHGIPSHDTRGRVFARPDPAAFGRCFPAWAAAVAPSTIRPRDSRDDVTGRAALHLVRAWAAESGLVLDQLAAAGKSNEITAIPRAAGAARSGRLHGDDRRHGPPDGHSRPGR